MKNSTFRETRITVAATTPQQYSEGNTRPNWFLFVNNSATYIYVGISPNVSTSVFEQIIPPYGTRTYARPDAPLEIWLYASGASGLYIASMEQDFDPTMISQTQEIATVNASGLLGNVNVQSILGGLPPGTNLIGLVDINSLPMLPSGNNLIGSVNVSQLPMLPAGTNLIGEVLTDGLKPSQVPTIDEYLCTEANTEYSHVLPAGTKRIWVNVQEQDSAFTISYSPTIEGVPPARITINAGGAHKEENILYTGNIYFTSATALKTIQILTWS